MVGNRWILAVGMVVVKPHVTRIYPKNCVSRGGQTPLQGTCLITYVAPCRVRRECMEMGIFGGYTRWAVVFLIIFVLFFLLVPGYGGGGYGAGGDVGGGY